VVIKEICIALNLTIFAVSEKGRNDMPRYIDADLLLEEVENNTPLNFSDSERELAEQFDFKVFKHIIEYQPTADVVPKSEVEKEIKNWQELYADTVSKWEKAYEELEIKLENAKAEVAREIFAELETKAPWFCENQTAYEHFNEELAELKKKYTEGDS
jgi:hypothetical protein